MITAKQLSLPHATKNVSDRQHYVNHSSNWISFSSTKSPLILKFYTVYIQAPCLLEIYLSNYIPVALEAIEEKTVFLYAFEDCSYAGFQIPYCQRCNKCASYKGGLVYGEDNM